MRVKRLEQGLTQIKTQKGSLSSPSSREQWALALALLWGTDIPPDLHTVNGPNFVCVNTTGCRSS